MDTTRAKHHTISDLSREVYEQIFQQAMNGTTARRHVKHFGAVQLAQVCKSWRDEVNSMPNLWSTVYVSPPECQEEVARFATILSKTALNPIRLFFVDEHDCDGLSPSVTGSLISALRGPIAQHAPQLVTLDICLGFPPPWLPPLLLSLFHNLKYPKLTTVEYVTLDQESESPRHNTEARKFWSAFAQDSHHLQKLSAGPAEWLLGRGFGASTSYSWSSLIKLSLLCVESVRSVLPPLRECHNLEYLDIQYGDDCEQSEWWMEEEFVDEDGDPLVIQLPRLERFYIHFHNIEAATTLACLTLPALKLLGLAWFGMGSCPLEYRQAAYDGLCELVKRSKCTDIRLALNNSGSCYMESFSQRRKLLPVLLNPDEDDF